MTTKSVCISALPKLRRPMSKARSWSWSDAAVASAALALCSSIRTINGRSRNSPSRLVTYVVSTSRLRPCVRNTTVPVGKNSDATSTAATTNPPGLPRRSRMSCRAPAPRRRLSASWTSSAALGPNSVKRTYPVVASTMRADSTEWTATKSRLRVTLNVSGSTRGPRAAPWSPSVRRGGARAYSRRGRLPLCRRRCGGGRPEECPSSPRDCRARRREP